MEIDPEPSVRLMMRFVVPELRITEPELVSVPPLTLIVCVTSAVNEPAISPEFPLVVKLPEEISSVEPCALPYRSARQAAAELMAGLFVNATNPILTSSEKVGGVAGVPLKTVQFAAFSHAVLTDPFQSRIPISGA